MPLCLFVDAEAIEAELTRCRTPFLAFQRENCTQFIVLMGSCYQVASIPEDERPVLGPFQADNSSDINDMIAFRMGGNLHAFQVCSA